LKISSTHILKYTKSQDFLFEECSRYISQKLDNVLLNEDPYPHIFIDEFLPINFYSELKSYFYSENFFKYFDGAVPVSHITDKSSLFIQRFLSEIVDSLLVIKFNKIFDRYDVQKQYELQESRKNIIRLNKPHYRSAYLAKNPANGTISSHLDDYWASYQFVFFLGDIFGNEIDTTELVDVSVSMQLLTSDNMEKKIIESCPRKSYKKTKNGFLAFINSNASVHGLSKPIEFERHTICISVHLYDEK